MDPRLRRLLPAAGLALALVAGLALAQPAAPPDGLPPPLPLAPPTTVTAPPAPSLGPVVAPPPQADAAAASQSEPDETAPPQAKAEIPPGPPHPERSPVAILRVLDKVTAETLRFEAPVGKRVRYKSLVFEVRACETWGGREPDPRPSAYLVVSADLGPSGGPDLGSREVYRGWMFAQAPGVHALQHPVYDAWLEACEGAPAPPV